jgi:ABC-type transport system involved in multi-copper enzyme maturation permease subunit
MIWLSWRQHRIEMLVLGIMLALIAAFLIYSSIAAYIVYYQVVQGTSVATCMQQHRQDALCQTLNSNFYMNFSAMKFLTDRLLHLALQPILLLVLLLQALVAMFLGAPLVASELERGTYRLVWTQNVTRLRWMAGKVGTQMGITLLLFALISLLVMWWNGPFDRLGGGVGPPSFDLEGIVPLAYMAYALSLAITAGTLLRKTVPAMAVTLVGYVAARITIDAWARPRYMPPLSVTWDPYSIVTLHEPFRATSLSGALWPYYGSDWVFYNGWVNHASHPIYDGDVYRVCSAPPNWDDGGALPGTPFTACTHAHGWLYMITYQPADRFWLYQGIESAIFLGLAAALLALAFWWVRERIS